MKKFWKDLYLYFSNDETKKKIKEEITQEEVENLTNILSEFSTETSNEDTSNEDTSNEDTSNEDTSNDETSNDETSNDETSNDETSNDTNINQDDETSILIKSLEKRIDELEKMKQQKIIELQKELETIKNEKIESDNLIVNLKSEIKDLKTPINQPIIPGADSKDEEKKQEFANHYEFLKANGKINF